MADLLDNATGKQILAVVEAAAAKAGIPVKDFLRRHRITDVPSRWIKQMAVARHPQQRTIDLVRRALAAPEVPAPPERKKPGGTRTRENGGVPANFNIEAARAASSARMARSRLAHAPDAGGRKGEELLVPAEIWLALEDEARARGIKPAACFALALDAGRFCLAEDRFEASQKRKG